MAEEQVFVGRNAREVFAKVRQALGRDAVIIEQRSGDGYVEVVASADFPEPDPSAALNDAFAARLSGLGYHDEFMARLPQGLSSWEAVADALPATLAYAAPGDPLQGVYRFVGAPGVGKTTTIIKLMADQVLRHGPASCALISADSRRLAGCEQLALSAELLSVEFSEVRDGDLNTAIAAHSDKRLVLIDTAGFSFGQRILAPVCGKRRACCASDVAGQRVAANRESIIWTFFRGSGANPRRPGGNPRRLFRRIGRLAIAVVLDFTWARAS